ncbi:MAG: hypothetical protein KAG89_00645 [Fulvimarina manganoxydans]|uniref:I78 family peptidase inhibitor n=1 Tax=Fulvimarina manganoxydans TaxID=937218 RepID=UPI002357005B|nr:I78 family peptidase inhibitor [Fulvimarina manganoxydans]MCK5930654.1 hypothetical protein [Fulvimarina manganoxydans]
MMDRSQRLLLACLAAFLLAGCNSTSGRGAPGSDSPSVSGESETACRAEDARFLIGRTADDETAPSAKAATRADRVRIVGPDDMVTQDFVPERLNLYADQSGRIVELRCG